MVSLITVEEQVGFRLELRGCFFLLGFWAGDVVQMDPWRRIRVAGTTGRTRRTKMVRTRLLSC